MAAVRMSQTLRNEILSQAMTTFENANPKSKYHTQTEKILRNITRKLTPHILESGTYKVSKAFLDLTNEQMLMYKDSEQIFNPTVVSKYSEDTYFDWEYNRNKISESITEQGLDDKFHGCTVMVHNFSVKLEFDAEVQNLTDHTHYAQKEEDCVLCPTQEDEVTNPDTITGSFNVTFHGTSDDSNLGIPWPMLCSLNGTDLITGMQHSRWGKVNIDDTKVTLDLTSLDRDMQNKLKRKIDKLKLAQDARSQDVREYRDKVRSILDRCTSIKQLLDFWPGADKFLPETVKEKLASKTTRSDNTAEREAAFAAIDIHDLNKTIVKANL